MNRDNEPLSFPVAVFIDTREQAPYTFANLRADSRQSNRPLLIETQTTSLLSGDYSLCGFADRIAVERKSLADLYQTLGHGRQRFERELHRLAEMDFAAIVVEADWQRILRDPPERSHLSPKSVYRSVIAWQQRIPNVHWWCVGGRRLAEVTTFRILERFWRDNGSPSIMARAGS